MLSRGMFCVDTDMGLTAISDLGQTIRQNSRPSVA